MKKRILLLSSSPRRHGNSDRLCDEFLRGAREAGHDAEKISLRDCRIGYCTGCGVCYDTRTCPQRDDAAQIVGKMIAADVIVFISRFRRLTSFFSRICISRSTSCQTVCVLYCLYVIFKRKRYNVCLVSVCNFKCLLTAAAV